MRYTIVSKGLTLAQMEKEILRVGGKSIKKAPIVEEIFCELDEKQANILTQVSGLKLRRVRVIRPTQLVTMERSAQLIVGERPTHLVTEERVLPMALPTVQQEATVSDVFSSLRDYFIPPIIGIGLTVAVLDTGVRKTHESLEGKVIYEYNCTDTESVTDVFGHGTGIVYLIAGGEHGFSEKCGVSPGAKIMNIKVMDDEGIGTDETIILGIDKVCSLARSAREQGLWPTSEMYPNIINISIGAEDTGEEDDPIRVACRKAVEDYDVDVIAAAGNTGPKRSTVMIPAVEPLVVAVGGVTTGGVEIWEKSSRGPTLLGDTKPDFVFWATELEQASNKDDESYVSKSGTSFSSPLVAGLAGLLWETGRRSYGEFWPFRWSQVLEFAPYYCTKPAEAAVVKDNTYGFGMPAMGTMIGQITRPEPTAEMMETMMPMIMMVMMVGLAGGVGGIG